MYKLKGETRKREFTLGKGKHYLVEYSWHRLNNGKRYHYIHCYKLPSRRPIKRWAWVDE